MIIKKILSHPAKHTRYKMVRYDEHLTRCNSKALLCVFNHSGTTRNISPYICLQATQTILVSKVDSLLVLVCTGFVVLENLIFYIPCMNPSFLIHGICQRKFLKPKLIDKYLTCNAESVLKDVVFV